jgi:hypothetical protein
MNAIRRNRKFDNKRKLKRYRYRCKISFTVDHVTYRGLSSNFSLNGLFIKTHQQFSPETLLDVTIYFPNDLTSQLKGRVVRASEEPTPDETGPTGEYRGKGMGIEIIEKDSLYLHFIRSLLSREGEDLVGDLVFSERESKYRKIQSELQNTSRLFDVFALLIGEQSKQAGFLGKVWLEAKTKNNTDYSFTEPVVVFMTVHDAQRIHNEKGSGLPEIGTVLMSSSDNSSHWKPGETIRLAGEIDLSSEDILPYERRFFDHLTETFGLVVNEPMNLDTYISTLWVGSPCLVADSPVVKRTSHS